jgi:hypothetical protein
LGPPNQARHQQRAERLDPLAKATSRSSTVFGEPQISIRG